MQSTNKKDLQKLYLQLLQLSIKNQFPNMASESLPEETVCALLNLASRLSLSKSIKSQKHAYEIATRIYTMYESPPAGITKVTNLILSRLGNFPGKTLIKEVHEDSQLGGSLYLLLESFVREEENSIEISGVKSLLTDFQFKLFSNLDNYKTVSFSAPTSAGKSHVLALEVVKLFKIKNVKSVVFIVPTRSLMRQVLFDLVEQLNKYDLPEVEVLSAPVPVDKEQLNKGVVYVLTQERLINLLYSKEGTPHVDMLIVDEAQEIEDDNRGMLLETSINKTLELFPEVGLLFSSPLRKNPEYLLSFFDREESSLHFREASSPVSQNLILLSNKEGRNSKNIAIIDLHFTKERLLPIGEIELPFPFRTSSGQRKLFARLAQYFTQDSDSSILYAGYPDEAETLADELIDLCNGNIKTDNEISEFIRFLSEHVHESYALINLLKKGVAYHYGEMPMIVRNRIEDLFKKQKIKFICCTSTLLQGINLPAKNIFIYKPKKGRTKDMPTGDFWNLVGRAGRLTREFQGNVWCILAENWSINPLTEEKLVSLHSAFQKGLQEKPDEILKVISDRNTPSEKKDGLFAEQAFARIFTEYTLKNKKISESYTLTEKQPILNEIDDLCYIAKEDKTLPEHVFQRNSTISPYRLEELASYLRENSEPIEKFIPNYEYGRIQKIFKILEDIFFKTGTLNYKRDTFIANKWLSGVPLNIIIKEKLDFEKTPNEPKKIGNSIRELLKHIEGTLRYKYVKYLRAYNDVLEAILIEKDTPDLCEKMVSLHLNIEFGAKDDVLINMISLGLSRTTAILLKKEAKIPSNTDRDKCIALINSLSLDELNIPQLCKEEILLLKRKK